MKLLNSITTRKLNFLFCLLLSHLFIVGAVSGDGANACKNIPTKDDWRGCKEHLEPKGFIPICPGSICDLHSFTQAFHDFCMTRGPYAVIPFIDCCNPETLQWIQNLPEYENIPLNEIFQTCMKLGDPWTEDECYCCCGGLESIKKELAHSDEKRNEL